MAIQPIELTSSSCLLKRTTTRCPVCLQPVPGEVWRRGAGPARVFLDRNCPVHGAFSVCLASDARFHWVSHGSAGAGCCGSADGKGGGCVSAEGGRPASLGRNASGRAGDPFETLSTCLALIEIVHSCNLACPTCYADSPRVHGNVDAVPLKQLQERIELVIARKGGIEILQLSGGEPTLHPEFFELLEWVQAHEKIDFVLVNTNGLRIGQDPAFAESLAVAAKRRGLQIYLQFDGPQAGGQHWLRGADLRGVRERALEVCDQIGLPVTLAMTVTPENLAHVWDSIQFGLQRRVVHGITFQPMFQSGRRPGDPGGGNGGKRLNTADILLAAVGQSDGRLTFDDFTPLPCGDPNCATIGYLLRLGGEVRSVSQFLNFGALQGFLRDRVNYRLEDLARCGCETEPLGELLRKLELRGSVAFRIMVKPFMDAWTWDEDRIDRCCTHVIRPDGRLDSFCRYYSGFPDVKSAP